jgi:cytochrome c-type biogenesis protein CcmH
MKSLIFAILTLLTVSCNSQSISTEETGFINSDNQLRYDALMEELRCLVCQNQSLADSNASLAQDLRGKVAGMIRKGHADKEIKDYMVQRYGEFILYRPRLNYATIVLWFGPFVLLFVAAGIIIRIVKSSKSDISIDQRSYSTSRDKGDKGMS